MGNFTISRYAGLEVAPDEVRVEYVLDYAEIPTVQEQQEIDTDRDGRVAPAERDAYLARARRDLPAGIALRADGAAVPLTVRSAEISFPPGAGNLPTMKLRLRLAGPLRGTAGRVMLEYDDRNYRERAGWKEVVVTAAPGVRIVETDALRTSLSAALTAYPEDLLNAPRQQTEARTIVALASEQGEGLDSTPPGGFARDGAAWNTPSLAGKRFAGRFTELIAVERLSGSVLLVSLLVAFVLGAAHALEPGHGKTVVAAYLVGSRGTPKHALWLGLIVTLTHTLGVFALGLATLFASAYLLPERLYPWLGGLSGLAITAVGLSLLARHARHAYAHACGLPHQHGRALAHEPAHDHGSDHSHSHAHQHGLSDGHGHAHHHQHDHAHRHDPSHDHGHGHGHAHHHHDYATVLDGRGVRPGSLLALGISGGIVPCPGALVVLLGAIAMHRVGFGLALLVAFSLGLAAVLTGIGLLMVSARDFLDRCPALGDGRWSERLAIASATVVCVLGVAIAVRAWASLA